MIHTHADGTPVDWSLMGDALPPFRPDPFHVSLREAKKFTFRQMHDVPHVTAVADIEEDMLAKGAVLEAWFMCRSPTFATSYYRETLLAAMAPSVYRISYSEDNFQKGMLAIWEHLPTWTERYPIKHEHSHLDYLRPLDARLDDVVRYLCGVAGHAMRGRKRKQTLFDSDLVVETVDMTTHEIDPLKYIDELPIGAVDKEILIGKMERLSETEIGIKVSLGRDQVKRRIQVLYQECCAKHNLRPKPMGRKPRFNMDYLPSSSRGIPTPA